VGAQEEYAFFSLLRIAASIDRTLTRAAPGLFISSTFMACYRIRIQYTTETGGEGGETQMLSPYEGGRVFLESLGPGPV
jgi:hypothetical protein